jgi:hypothetical protein
MQSLKAKKPLKKKIGTLKKMRGGMRGAPANADQFELWTQQMERKRPLDQDEDQEEDPRSDFGFIPPTVEHRPAMPQIQNGIKSVMMKLGINTKEGIIPIILKGIIKVKRMNGYSKSSLTPFEKSIDRFIKQSHYINDEINEDINVALELSKLVNYRMDAKDLLFDEIEATLDTEKLQEIMGQWLVADLVCQIKQVEKDAPYEYERKIVGVVTDFLKDDRAEINRLMNTEYKAQKPPVIGMSIEQFIEKLILFEEKFEELVNAQVLYWLNGNKDKNDVDSKHQSLTSIFKVGGTGIAVLDKWILASSVTISDELKLKLKPYVFIDNDPIDCVQAIEDATNPNTPSFVKETYEKFIDEIFDSVKASPGLGEEELGQAQQVFGQVAQVIPPGFHIYQENQFSFHTDPPIVKVNSVSNEISHALNDVTEETLHDIGPYLLTKGFNNATEGFNGANQDVKSVIVGYGIATGDQTILELIQGRTQEEIYGYINHLQDHLLRNVVLHAIPSLLGNYFIYAPAKYIGRIYSLIPINQNQILFSYMDEKQYARQKTIIEYLFNIVFFVGNTKYMTVQDILFNIATLFSFWIYQRQFSETQTPDVLNVFFELHINQRRILYQYLNPDHIFMIITSCNPDKQFQIFSEIIDIGENTYGFLYQILLLIRDNNNGLYILFIKNLYENNLRFLNSYYESIKYTHKTYHPQNYVSVLKSNNMDGSDLFEKIKTEVISNIDGANYNEAVLLFTAFDDEDKKLLFSRLEPKYKGIILVRLIGDESFNFIKVLLSDLSMTAENTVDIIKALFEFDKDFFQLFIQYITADEYPDRIAKVYIANEDYLGLANLINGLKEPTRKKFATIINEADYNLMVSQMNQESQEILRKIRQTDKDASKEADVKYEERMAVVKKIVEFKKKWYNKNYSSLTLPERVEAIEYYLKEGFNNIKDHIEVEDLLKSTYSREYRVITDFYTATKKDVKNLDKIKEQILSDENEKLESEKRIKEHKEQQKKDDLERRESIIKGWEEFEKEQAEEKAKKRAEEEKIERAETERLEREKAEGRKRVEEERIEREEVEMREKEQAEKLKKEEAERRTKEKAEKLKKEEAKRRERVESEIPFDDWMRQIKREEGDWRIMMQFAKGNRSTGIKDHQQAKIYKNAFIKMSEFLGERPENLRFIIDSNLYKPTSVVKLDDVLKYVYLKEIVEYTEEEIPDVLLKEIASKYRIINNGLDMVDKKKVGSFLRPDQRDDQRLATPDEVNDYDYLKSLRYSEEMIKRVINDGSFRRAVLNVT